MNESSMNICLGRKAGLLCITSMLVLSGCGSGGGSDTATLDTSNTSNALYYFQGNTPSSGRELWKSDGTEAGTALVKEINTQGHSYASNFTEVGTSIFFSADGGVHGKQLWKKDINGETLVKVVNPSGNGKIYNLTDHNGVLYFTAYDGTSYGLWKSDGTADGTLLVHTANSINNLTSLVDGTLYFTIRSNELWRSTDGVSASLVNTTNTFSSASQLTAVGSQLYFIANASGAGYELWTSNGTDAGTDLLKDVRAGSVSGFNPNNSRLFSMNGDLYFTATDGLDEQFWVSDGTAVGTVKWLDASASPLNVRNYYKMGQTSNGIYYTDTSANRVWSFDGTTANEVTTKFFNASVIGVAGNQVFFQDYNNSFWVTDGTDIGSINVIPSEAYSYLHTSVATNSGLAVVIRKHDPTTRISSYSLWFSDGTVAGTSSILNLNDSTPNLYPVGSNVYLSFNDETHGVEPWISDGTVAGTALIADINTSSNGDSYPYDPVFIDNIMFFVADDGLDGYGLWRTDGSIDGTYLVKNTNPDGDDDVYSLKTSGGKVYFVASTNEQGHELWVSDGTEAGTQLVVDLDPGANSSAPEELTDVNGTLFFQAAGLLWKTDGTEEGTLLVSLVYPERMTAAGDNLFFVARNENRDDQVWVSDGTLSGTHLIKTINPDNDAISYRQTLHAVGNEVYFVANDGANGDELWKSDGTEAGTVMAADINPVGDGLDESDSILFVVNDDVYFTAQGPGGDLEIWKTDDSNYGAVKLSDFSLDNGAVESRENSFGSMNGELYFSADDGTNGYELWKTDGTVDGTVLVKDINVEIVENIGSSSNPYGFYANQGQLFFMANDGVHGTELWVSDGTMTGTHLVKDVRDGLSSGSEALESGD